MKLPKLFFGPMSTQIIEAVYQVSAQGIPLGLIASRNQVDEEGGYVNGWSTEEYARHLAALSNRYPQAHVWRCRDHSGPGFKRVKPDGIKEWKRSIQADVFNHFDIIHIDPCRHLQPLAVAKDIILYLKDLNPRIQIEVGTEENDIGVSRLDQVDEETDYFLEFCKPCFYVVRTGSLIRRTEQVGRFDPEHVRPLAALLHSKGMLLKEHNADYLSFGEIAMRRGLVDALNIAPQLGVIQTQATQMLMKMWGREDLITNWANIVIVGNHWKKWGVSREDREECIRAAGHYHFSDHIYRQMEECGIGTWVNLAVMEVICHYVRNFYPPEEIPAPSDNDSQSVGFRGTFSVDESIRREKAGDESGASL